MAEAESSEKTAGDHRHVIAGIFAITLAALVLLARASYEPRQAAENLVGVLGHALAKRLTHELGAVAWLVPLELALLAFDLFTQQSLWRSVGRGIVGAMIAALLHVGFADVRVAGEPLGGRVGAYGGELAAAALGPWGVAIVVAGALVSMLVLFRASLGPEPLWQWLGVDQLLHDETAAKLVQTLASLGVFGTIEAVRRGPGLVTYEFAPREGLKLSRIAGLGNDLTLRLGASVRVIAPIPGTTRVGFELATGAQQDVTLRKLLADPRWVAQHGPLPVALGRDSSDQPVFADLSAMPHLLIAGTTGAGKSVGLNSMLASLLTRRTAAELRLLIIDPKMVEFATYAELPHLLAPVITDIDAATAALRWAVGEMERRYKLLAEAGARNVAGFNERTAEERLPYILIVVDELADLLMAGAKEAELCIARLAQKARAAGIHLVLATQRPSADVITGTIKANFPARIAYKVSQREDSRTILGRGGAEHLLGKGDMLFLPPGSTDLRRVHGAHVTDAELSTLCSRLRALGAPQYVPALLPASSGSLAGAAGELPMLLPGSAENGPREPLEGVAPRPLQATVHTLPSARALDELYQRALELVAVAGYCSISHLQRQLSIGYNRAAKLVERMEGEGIIGPASSSAAGRREVLREVHP